MRGRQLTTAIGPAVNGNQLDPAPQRDVNPLCSACGGIAPAAPMAAPRVSSSTDVLFLLDGIPAVVGGTSYDLDPTGLVVFPAGIGGTFAVTSKAAYFLAITSGDGAGRFFADFARTVRPIDQPQRRWQPTGP